MTISVSKLSHRIVVGHSSFHRLFSKQHSFFVILSGVENPIGLISMMITEMVMVGIFHATYVGGI
ncbi:hypothetical protein F2Q70_00007333 [Brassica cretica]|uniref:Uncharacterized protein n=1 Tax=Brassica cretica TaxID=69181 RepID=A0A8S9P3N2_BRACR|nr:hypothetical protein F2Q70_00007333 [Brassica cretica]KAF3511748.1 hypothetical protein F2Q69_00000484 [Brassica cretica]